MSWLLLIAVVLPLSLAPLAATRWHWVLAPLSVVAALPPLFLATATGVTLELSWLLLGLRLGVDSLSQPFLLLTGVLWLATAFYAWIYCKTEARAARFHGFLLLTLAGNIGVVVAQDMVSFYLFFTLMTFAAYGLIVHHGNVEARRAGNVYLVLALLGEVLLLAAIILLTANLDTTDFHALPAALAEALATGAVDHTVLWLAPIGFAIKLGVVPLHVWLPLAHPCAPIPASALLSGILLKIGLLGWLRFLPLGALALPALGEACVLLGTLGVFYGVAAGLLQQRPKTVLAYSSVSQMGLLSVLIGIGLSAPQQWPLIAFAVVVFSLHHGLAKATLFLALGVGERVQRLCLSIVPALALIGAPLTSGALAKLVFKDATAGQTLAPPFAGLWEPIDVAAVLGLSSVTTGLLLLRLLYLVGSDTGKPVIRDRRLTPIVLVLTVAGLIIPWAWALLQQPALSARAFDSAYLLSTSLSVLTSALLAGAVWLLWRVVWGRPLWRLPEGDLLALVYMTRRLSPALGLAKRTVLDAAGWHRPSFSQYLLRVLRPLNDERLFPLLLLLVFVVFLAK